MLSIYSSQSLDVLLQRLPDLADFVTLHDTFFAIDLITPSGWGFGVSSDQEELTVGFAEYHTHFGWSEGPDAVEDATEAADFIESLRTGELVLAVWYKGAAYVRSQPLEVGADPRAGTWFQRWRRQGQTLTVKSWT